MHNHSRDVVAAIQVGRQVPVEIAKKMSDFGLVDHRPESGISRFAKCKLSLLLCPSCELDTCLIRVYKICPPLQEKNRLDLIWAVLFVLRTQLNKAVGFRK